MQSLKKFVKVDLVFSAGIFQPMKKMVVKNGVRCCTDTSLKTNRWGEMMTFYGSIHWGLFFKFRFSFSISASYDFNFLIYSCSENREKKRKIINLCEIDPSCFYAVISHCQCQSALERKICSCKKNYTLTWRTRGLKIWKKFNLMKMYGLSQDLVIFSFWGNHNKRQSFFHVNKEIQNRIFLKNSIFLLDYFSNFSSHRVTSWSF